MGAVTRAADGSYIVDVNGRREIVYVAGPPANRWTFWNGRVFRGDFTGAPAGSTRRGERSGLRQGLSAPMPSKVLKVLVSPGAVVKKGDTIVVLEAMKMELPVRSPADGTVAAVRCREGELVDADAVLVELQ